MVDKTIKTGAEPWNIVISPDGKRVFVANSGQDTITVINAVTRTIIGDVNLRDSLCNDPDRDRHFQPRGMAVTQDNAQLYVTRFLSFTGRREAGRDDGKEGLVCRLNINTNFNQHHRLLPAEVIRLQRAALASRSIPTATPPPTRPPRSRTSFRASSSAAIAVTCPTSPLRPRDR